MTEDASDLPMRAPTICLNMIVRNESHVITELFDTMLPHINTWVIVDTGSTDGTQDLIRDYFADRGVPGVLYERPWRNFGENRTEAVQLAHGHADYIWQMDADDLFVGTPDLSSLTADRYALRVRLGNIEFWRPHIFRDGLPWRWLGVLHEYNHCDVPVTEERLPGDCFLQARTGGARSQDPEKFLRDAEILLAEVKRNPDDTRSVFYLAQSYRDHGDPRAAREWYAKRAEMGGWDEEVFLSLLRVAECSAALGDPWPEVLDAYLKAWAYRPTRVEPLCCIATHYRNQREWQLGYFFAERAAQLTVPEDRLFVRVADYTISAPDEQAICAYWLGKYTESFVISHRLLARDELSDDYRQRIVANRDFSVPAMLEAAESYPEALARDLAGRTADIDVTATLIAGPDRATTEATLNSLLHYCTDIDRIRRFLVLDTGLTEADRDHLAERYPFVELRSAPGTDLPAIRSLIDTRFWLHLGRGWRLFAPEALVGRLAAILDVEPDLYQVGVNFEDARAAANKSAPQDIVRSSPETGRYVMTDTAVTGPAMYDVGRYDRRPATGGVATLADIIATDAPLAR